MKTIRKYEIVSERFELSTFSHWPSMTKDELFDAIQAANEWAGWSAPITEVSFPTLEEAQSAFENDYKRLASTHHEHYNRQDFLTGTVYWIEANDYDEDGDFDQGSGPIEFAAEPYTSPYDLTYWFVNADADIDSIYGTADPYCMTSDEVKTLSLEWDVDLFEQMHEASVDEISRYGTC